MKNDGKIIVITGANSGIGLETAKGLAKQGASIIMVCRDHERGSKAMSEISKYASGNPPSLYIADLSSQAAIRSLANELTKNLSHIDVLINNAGAAFSKKELTIDKIERTFAINYLAPFLLTNLLLDKIKNSDNGRIVNVTSRLYYANEDFFDNIQGEVRYNSLLAYKISKLSLIYFTYELARKLDGSSVTVNCLEPGPALSEFGKKAGGWMAIIQIILRPFFSSTEKGAATPIYLASSPEVKNITGGFFIKCQQHKTKSITYNKAIASKLWSLSEKLTNTRYGL